MTDSKNSHFQLVGEFHDTFGHPLRTKVYTDCFTEEPKLIPFRVSLIVEELKEFNDAYENKDFSLNEKLVEMADALCDMSYVINGAGHCLGFNLDDLLKTYRIDIKTPYEYTTCKPNKHKVSSLSEYTSQISEFNESMNRFIETINESSQDKNINYLGFALVHMIKLVYELGHSLKFNMDGIFREVHRSNMTKVCSSIEEGCESIKFYKQEGRYQKPSMRQKGSYYVVFDEATSKILKNHKWTKPDIKQFIY